MCKQKHHEGLYDKIFCTYRILHDLSFYINFYELSLENVIKRAFGEAYNIPGTSFIRIYIEMTTSVKFFVSNLLEDA